MGRILVIEDDSDVRSMIREILGREGHDVVDVTNGAEGLRAYREHPTDLVITDIMLPAKDGVEIIRELKRDHPEARVIAITGLRGTYNRLPAARFVGAERTIVKPFGQDQLLEAVNALLA